MRHTLENIELSDEIQKIREKTFNTEFKELIRKVIYKPQDTIDNPESLLYSLHKLYYTVLSKSFNDAITFVIPEILSEYTLQFIGEELNKKLKNLGFVETLIFQYDFKQNYFGIQNNSFDNTIFRDFFITASDDLYKNIISNPDGVVIDIASLKNDKLYEKRLRLFEDESFSIWVFSSFPLIQKVLEFLNISVPFSVEIFCPVIFVRVHKNFAINQKIISELYNHCISLFFFLMESCLATSKGSLFLCSNYFHEVFKVFENYYYIAQSNKCVKYVIIKSKYEDEIIYCLFRYLSNKFKKLKSYSSINYRPMIGLIILFLNEESVLIDNEIKTINSLFGNLIKIKQVETSKIKNAINLYNCINDL